MFIAALLIVAKIWKQLKCPSTDEWIKKMWDFIYIYKIGYYSAIKRNEMMPFAAMQMDLENIVISEISQTKADTVWYHLYVESKIWHKWNYLWNRNRLTDIENRLVVAKGEMGRGGIEWEFGVSTCKLLYIEWINNKVLLYNTGNYTQYPVINHNGKEYEKIYMYNWITLLYSRN